mmetsp:Transcript_36632/g.81528  ORF Transcript_36632/g.81528 Transcript_36632/m.81528 type:complete len:499 (-) Transcript_36632:621-2117(-)
MEDTRHLSEADVRNILERMHVNTTFLTDTRALGLKLAKLLKKAEDLTTVARGEHDANGAESDEDEEPDKQRKPNKGVFDPQSLPKWPKGGSFQKLFSGMQVFSPEEIVTGGNRHVDPFFEVRLTLQDMMKHAETLLSGPNQRLLAIMQDPGAQVALTLDIHGVRQAPLPQRQKWGAATASNAGAEGVPVVLLHYSFKTQADIMASVAMVGGDASAEPHLKLIGRWTQTARVLQVKAASVQEVLLLKQVLDLNAATLSQAYIQSSRLLQECPQDPASSSFTPSFLLPLRPLDPQDRDSRNELCLVCGQRTSKCCSGCGLAKYCSVECQRSHWKEHKPNCTAKAGKASASTAQKQDSATGSSTTPATIPDGESIIVDLSAGQQQGVVMSLLNFKSAMGPQQVSRGGDMSASILSTHGTKPFIVKVQAPRTGDRMDLMMYDQKHSFTAFVSTSQREEHATILRLIRQHGVEGMKAYLWAAHEGPNKLRIRTSVMPSQSVTW